MALTLRHIINCCYENATAETVIPVGKVTFALIPPGLAVNA